MTNEQLRIRAAELAGWKKSDSEVTMSSCPGETIRTGRYWWKHTDGGMLPEIPDYPNDIAAAWDLMKILRDHNGKGMSIFFGLDMKDEYTVNVWWRNGRCAEIDDFVDACAPHAITRAFIAAMEAVEE